jgi:hypothetical protein
MMESKRSGKHCSHTGLPATRTPACFRPSVASSVTSSVATRLSRRAITRSSLQDNLSCDQGSRLLYAESWLKPTRPDDRRGTIE